MSGLLLKAYDLRQLPQYRKKIRQPAPAWFSAIISCSVVVPFYFVSSVRSPCQGLVLTEILFARSNFVFSEVPFVFLPTKLGLAFSVVRSVTGFASPLKSAVFNERSSVWSFQWKCWVYSNYWAASELVSHPIVFDCWLGTVRWYDIAFGIPPSWKLECFWLWLGGRDMGPASAELALTGNQLPVCPPLVQIAAEVQLSLNFQVLNWLQHESEVHDDLYIWLEQLPSLRWLSPSLQRYVDTIST